MTEGKIFHTIIVQYHNTKNATVFGYINYSFFLISLYPMKEVILMSQKIISSKNLDELETIENELENIIYLFDVFLSCEDFYTFPTDRKSRARTSSCQKCLYDTFEKLKVFEKDLKNYSNCIRTEKDFNKN